MSNSPTQIAARLKQSHPKLYKKLTQDTRPQIPGKTLKSLSKIAQALADGKIVTVPVRKGALLAVARIYWEEGEYANVMIEHLKPNPKATSRNEKKLVGMLTQILSDFTNDRNTFDVEDVVEAMADDVCKSQEFKSFRKECKDFCQELSRYEATYDFDYDQDIGIYREFN